MRKSIVICALVASVVAAPLALAQDKAPHTMPAMNTQADKDMAPMQDNIKKMQDQMDKIAVTSDPKEREKLMQEHMQTLQENMKAMRSMGGPMMRRDRMAPSDKMGAGTSGGDMKMRQEKMEKRMDMMQMMMEQMMQRDAAAKPMGHM